MDYISLPDNIRDILDSVIKQAIECVKISRIYLFGSYYNGTHTEDSDLDIAFFIKTDESLLSAHRKIIKLTSKYPVDIQPQVFYECELKDGIGIVGEILENGTIIYAGQGME